MTFAELERVAFAQGWQLVRFGDGSARIYRHPLRAGVEGVLVIHFHGSKSVPTGTLKAALKRIYGPQRSQE